MKKSTVAAWIGASLVLATAMSLLRQSQAVVAPKPGNAATVDVERELGTEGQQIVAGNAVQIPEVKHTPTDVDEHIQRTALRSISSTILPSPPLPSRVMPGPVPTSERAVAERQGDLLPMPPVPSKTPPGPIPEGARNGSNAIDETGP